MIRKLAMMMAVVGVSCGYATDEERASVSRAALGTDTAQYNFEAGLQGWVKSGTKITSIATSTTQVFLGAQSMKVNVVTTGAATGQQVILSTSQQLAGKTITFHIFPPTGVKLSSLQVFGQENASNGWRWDSTWVPLSGLTLNAWNTISVTIPSDAAPLQTLGVQFDFSASWSGAIYVDSIGWPTGADGGVDAGVDAGTDAGVDAGFDAGVDAGFDAGIDPDAGIDAGTDAGDIDAGVDAGTDAGVDAGIDAGVDAGIGDGGIFSIRFGVAPGASGVFSNAPANPNLRTVTGWVRLRVTSVRGLQEAWFTFENDAPSTVYQLLCTTWQVNQWQSHDSAQGGFLFTPNVGVGEWWFIAESNRAAGPATMLCYKKLGAASLSCTTGNTHPSISGITRMLIGTDDATGQNEWVDGDISGVKVWDAELTQTEIAAEALQLSPVRTANLHAFYPLQSVSTMLNDTSGNGRNLAPITTGGSWTVQSGPTIPY